MTQHNPGSWRWGALLALLVGAGSFHASAVCQGATASCEQVDDTTALLQQSTMLKQRKSDSELETASEFPAYPSFDMSGTTGFQTQFAEPDTLQMWPGQQDWAYAPAAVMPDYLASTAPMSNGFEGLQSVGLASEPAATMSNSERGWAASTFNQNPIRAPSELDQFLPTENMDWPSADTRSEAQDQSQTWSRSPSKLHRGTAGQASHPPATYTKPRQQPSEAVFSSDRTRATDKEQASLDGLLSSYSSKLPEPGRRAMAHLARGAQRSDLDSQSPTMSPDQEFKSLDNLLQSLSPEKKSTGSRPASLNREGAAASASHFNSLDNLEQVLQSAPVGRDNFNKMLSALSPAEQETDTQQKLNEVLSRNPMSPISTSEALKKSLTSHGSQGGSEVLEKLLHRFAPHEAGASEPAAAGQMMSQEQLPGLSAQQNSIASRSIKKSGQTPVKALESLDLFLRSNGLGRIAQA